MLGSYSALRQPFLRISKWRPACATSSVNSMLIRPYTPSVTAGRRKLDSRRLIAHSPVAPGLRLDRHLGGAVVFWHMDTTGVFSSRKLECATYGDDLAISTRCRSIAFVSAGGPDRGGTLALFRAGGAEDVGGGGALIVGRSYCPTSGHASNDKCGANISSLDNLGIKSPRPAIIRGRMNDT